MSRVTGLTAAKMLEIANKAPVSGFVDLNGHLLLETLGGDQLDLGNVVGPTGPAGKISGATATTLAAGQAATVVLGGSVTDRTFAFGIPQGTKGDKGDTGATGGADTIPTGAIIPFSGSTAPNGFLLCQGQAVSRTTYANLYGVIGTTYGVGDGSTTFNVPDLRGRVPVGLDGTTDFLTLGQAGGSKTVTLSTNEMPAHTHLTYTDTGAATFGTSGSGNFSMPNSSGLNARGVSGSAGGGGAHNNLQPYRVVNYIIKHIAALQAADSELTGRISALEQKPGYWASFAAGTAAAGTVMWTNPIRSMGLVPHVISGTSIDYVTISSPGLYEVIATAKPDATVNNGNIGIKVNGVVKYYGADTSSAYNLKYMRGLVELKAGDQIYPFTTQPLTFQQDAAPNSTFSIELQRT